ncbi:DNA polymerase II [Vibrio phage vB_VhaM_VH-8]|nr:DNA polymerase II [Vibrio phage vB_VhaM_VH-8]
MKYQEWHKSALELHEKGFSGRKIAKKLGMGKTQINDVLKAYREGRLELSEPESKKIKYLYFDLESSLMEGYFFKIWDENIPITRVKKHSHLLTAAWATNDGEVGSIRISPEDVKTGNDLAVVVKMIEMINSCDVLVSYNGKRFDLKLLNTRAIYWGLPPIAAKKHVDLFEQAKKSFKFPSNSMQNVSKYLGLEGKLATGGTLLWERCANFDDKEVCNEAIIEMETYNRQDIEATRDLHKRLQGWGKNTPNIGTIAKSKDGVEGLRCTHCGSSDVSKIMIDGVAKQGYTSVSSFDLYRCGESNCRGVSRVNASGKALVNYI